MMYRGLAGRVAIVTGGAQGIGKAICSTFLDGGSSVVIADLDVAHGTATAEELSAHGPCAFVKTDIAEEQDVIAAVSFAVSRFGGVSFLVNNASAFIMRGIEATVDEWRRMLDVNIIGYALCSKHAAREMKHHGGGAIVNISSISAFIAQKGLLTYSTTKAAISNMTRLTAMELAPHGIRVNAVCPGTVWSDNNAEIIRQTMGLDRAGADAHPDVGGKAMLHRTADPVEIARVVVFLASDDASFITAANVVVDGGYTAL